ncbi:nose resistant to fluoxetine protein 6-like [Amyelois transitella]|uniref:nose resistant to fluoxetine protein 6-like n=1 Tax=Amyelois transitella TaxID=680683 RepID=UPI00298F7E56|nr:nose resistant to fluoxetine protein 6-like [Amyelois transitella]
MKFLVFNVVFVFISGVNCRLDFKNPNTVFDQALYEDVLDDEECDRQVEYLQSDLLLNLEFIDAGLRLPRGVLMGNGVDLGNYHQCLRIDETRGDLEIKGKYCMIRVPFNQNLDIFEMIRPSTKMNNKTELEQKFKETHKIYEILRAANFLDNDFNERSLAPDNPLSGRAFRLAVCIPRPCSVEQAMTSALFNLTSIGFQFEEDFCRLPGDKPWSAGDYVAVSILSFIGLLTLLSTSYDVNHTFIQKQDPKQANVLLRSFSLYTNGKRLTSFASHPNSLPCLDGIRSIAMLWVVIGHTFITENFIINVLDFYEYALSAKALWLTSAPYTVDTFFMMTGLLLVYTTVGKLTGKRLLQNLHLFYLNRLVRLFPLLALAILLDVSLLNRIFDGPYWNTMADYMHSCKEFWWTTLLHIQNYATPSNMCVVHSWYVAIDVQLHIVSPLVLFWVLSKSRKTAWIVLAATLIVLYGTTTYYNAYKDFTGHFIVTSRPRLDYMENYYFNTFTRAGPFFVGMVFGYILNIYKGRRPKIHYGVVLLLWACSLTLFGLLIYSVYEVMRPTWNNSVVDVILNTYGKSVWAVALGWIIFACVHGYGGPINWFLCLDIWKLPSRLSYAMYLFHYPLQHAINSTALTPSYFCPSAYTFKFLAYAALTYIVSFIACLTIDAPFSVLFKLLLGDGGKKHNPEVSDPNNNVIGTSDVLQTEDGARRRRYKS